MVSGHRPARRKAVATVLRLIAALVMMASLTACGWAGASSQKKAAPASASGIVDEPTSFFNSFGGSSFHLYAEGIDWREPVGILYYFSGDYFKASQAEVFRPEGGILTGLADEAAKRNMILIAPIPPSAAGPNGHTWWERGDENLEWFLDLSSHVTSIVPASSERTWFMGYSGGAEFITYYVLPDSTAAVGNGGAVMVGGGGAPTKALDSGQRSGMWLAWSVGDRDTQGATNPPEWSAYDAATEGEAFYAQHGFDHTTITVIADAAHLDYDLPEILSDDMDRAGVEKVPPHSWFPFILVAISAGASMIGLGILLLWRAPRSKNRSRRPA